MKWHQMFLLWLKLHANSATATVLKLQTSDDHSEIDFGNVPK